VVRRLCRWLGAVTLTAVTLGSTPLTPPAGAKVTEIGGTKVGLQARNTETVYDGIFKRKLNEATTSNPGVESFANASGNPVLHSVGIYAIYWDPQDYYHGDWQELINLFLNALGQGSGEFSSLFSVLGQYSDSAGKHAATGIAFRGAAVDTTPYPTAECIDPQPFEKLAGSFPTAPTPNCLTDHQVREELSAFIAAHGLPRGPGTIYDVLTPPGVAVCLDAGGASGHCSEFEKGNEASYARSFCSYHGYIGATEAEAIVYDMIPWSAGGVADNHLATADHVLGTACQDGGFNPVTQVHEATQVDQEPNQASGLGPDGTYDHGLADLITNQIAVEEQDTVTDPFLNAWQDSEGNEATDECRNFFAPKLGGGYGAQENTEAGNLYNQQIAGQKYYLNTAFNLAAAKLYYPGVPCISGIQLQASFTAPTPVNAGEVVGFDGMQSVATLDWAGLSLSAPGQTYATMTWDFGDGSAPVTGYAPGTPPCSSPWLSPCAGTEFHTYAAGGEYVVSLTVKDTAGHESTLRTPIHVIGPAPAPTTPSAGSGGGSSTSSSSGSHAAPTYPAPSARAAAVSGSLTAAVRHGLVLRYTVNEQVAGVAEALISAKLARRLHIRAPLAVGLPRGYPRSVVIGRAVLVTRKGGTGQLRLHFSKAVAKALRKVRRVTLTLRMVLRNAESSNPKSITMLSKIVLKGGGRRH
jgi:hypothetical protein